MAAFATLALAGVVTVLVAWGIVWITSKFPDRNRSSWNDVGGLGLLAGLVVGFTLMDVLANPDRWEWGFVVWPGIFAGMFAGVLPTAQGSHRVIGWWLFAAGALGGLVIGAMLSVF